MARDPSTAVSFGMLEDVLGFRMQRLRAAIAKPLIAGMKRWGLRRGAFMVLALVAENPGLSQTVLVRETGIRMDYVPHGFAVGLKVPPELAAIPAIKPGSRAAA